MPLTEHVDVFTAAATTHILSTLEGALVEAVDHATHTTIYATATADANGAAILTIDPPRVYCLRIDGVIAASDHQYGSGEQPRPPGVVIAASDASLLSRAWADRICDGTNDDVDIQWGIDTGSPVTLTEGHFTIAATIYHNQPTPRAFQGTGQFSTILQPATNFAGPLLFFGYPSGAVLRGISAGNFGLLHDRSFKCDGMRMDRFRESYFYNILIRGFQGYGLKIGDLPGIAETSLYTMNLRGNGHWDSVNGEGTATAGGAATLTDAGKAWTVDEWIGYCVSIRSGTGVGQTKRILSNTATVLTVNSDWTVQPNATSVYRIDKPNLMIENSGGTDSSNNINFFGAQITQGMGGDEVVNDIGRNIVSFGFDTSNRPPRGFRFDGALIHGRITGGTPDVPLVHLENPYMWKWNSSQFITSTAITSDLFKVFGTTNNLWMTVYDCILSSAGAGYAINLQGGNYIQISGNHFNGSMDCINIASSCQFTTIHPNTASIPASKVRVTDAGVRTRNTWEAPLWVSNNTEGNVGRNSITSLQAVSPTLNGATTDIGITIPGTALRGRLLLGVQFCVNTVIPAPTTSWSAAFVGGSTTSLGTGYLLPKNTKINRFIAPEQIVADTDIRLTAAGGNFAGGVVEVVVYYMEMTDMLNQP